MSAASSNGTSPSRTYMNIESKGKYARGAKKGVRKARRRIDKETIERSDMNEHRWSYCSHCMCVMVHCGHCNNNTCNGGTGDNCPDNCASAHAFESANTPPPELRARQDKENAEWAAMTPDERDLRNQKIWDGMFPSLP